MRWIKPTLVAAALVTLAACADDIPTATVPGRHQPPRTSMNPTTSRVVAYFPTWEGNVATVPYTKVTHLLYAFLLPTATGGVTGIPMSGDTRLTALVDSAHNHSVKVLISVGGWSTTNDSIFRTMAASSTARSTFESNLVTFVTNYGLDGVDMDWEYPSSGTEPADFASLMGELATAMHTRSKLLTAAVDGDRFYGDSIKASVLTNVDFLTLMAYAKTPPPHSPFSFASSALDYWLWRGLPASKAVLGVPFYGKNSAGTDMSYAGIVAADANAPYADYSNGYYYNGLSTMQQKTTLSLQRGSGVSVWELAQDASSSSASLLNAIQTAMNSTVPAYDYTRTVFDDSPGNWVDYGSWDATINYADTTHHHTGTKSIAVTYTAAWGGMYLHNDDGVYPAGLTHLEFWVNGGGNSGQELVVEMGSDEGQWYGHQVSIDGYTSCGGVLANTWCKVSIPLSTLGMTSTPTRELAIESNANAAQPTVYIDDIRFVP